MRKRRWTFRISPLFFVLLSVPVFSEEAENRNGQPITVRQLARLLEPLGIRPKQLRMGEANIRGSRRGLDYLFAIWLLGDLL